MTFTSVLNEILSVFSEFYTFLGNAKIFGGVTMRSVVLVTIFIWMVVVIIWPRK